MRRLLAIAALLLATPLAAQLPAITPAQYEAAGLLPHDQAVAILSLYDAQSVLDAFRAKYGRCEFTGYMHTTDHQAALVCLLEREPTYKEVYDSWCITGASNISAAARKCGGGAFSLQSCLSLALGTNNGARVYDRIYAGEVGLVKGKYAGILYDCSEWPLPGGTIPPKPTDPPAPPGPEPQSECPPQPPACTPRAFSVETVKTMDEARGWVLLGPKRRTRLLAAIDELLSYEPCLESTGQNVMNLWLYSPPIGATNPNDYPGEAFEGRP